MPRSPALPPTLPDSVLDWEATIYRDSFKHFIVAFWEQVSGAGHLIHNWHIDFLAEELEKTTFNVKANLPREHDIVVNVPFGCSKSSIISILFPAWVWTFFPEARFISGTHTKELALDLAVKSKGVILSEKYQTLYPHVKLVKDTEGYFINTFGGDRLTCTVGGVTPTGFHAHWILIDDPIDPQGARSELELDTAKKFMTEIIPGRKVDKDASVTVLVMQRLEYRDPTAVMLKLAEDPNVIPVRHVCLPGELSEDVSPPLEEIRESFPQAYIFDDLLDSKRLSRRVLNGYRVTLGNSYWSQIMQKPTPPGGGMFKCLVANTMVRTNRGEITIQSVREGDKVYTRDGLRRVTKSGCSGYTDRLLTTTFSNGAFITSTLNHKIWETSRGFVEASDLWLGATVISLEKEPWKACENGLNDSLENQDHVLVGAEKTLQSKSIIENKEFPVTFMDITHERPIRRWWSSMVFYITSMLKDIGSVKEERIPCIEPSGDITTARYLRNIKFITRMKTQVTIVLRIWNALLTSSIDKLIGLVRGLLGKKNWQRQQRSGLARTPRKDGVDNLTNNTSVSCVGKNISPELVDLRVTAQESVKLKGIVPVYDLEVEGAHEFFANNILVHNSQYFINRVKAAPYEARRIRYWDRACLVGGTLICTNKGQIPIEDVKCGHKVYTRQEWKRVVWSGQTGVEKPSELVKMEFKLPRNSEVFMRLMGTKDHKIWTKNLGFVSLGSIQGKDDEIGLLVMSYLEDLPVYDFPVHANDDPVPVYDLEVEDAHEFYANGVLVHNSTQDGGCYTAGVLMAKDKDGFYYVEHVVHGQWEPFQRNAIIASTALRDRVRYGPKWEPVVWIEEETGSTGKESFQRMAAQLSGYQVRSDKPTGSKDTRADPWSSACAAAIVKIVDNGESKNYGKSDWDVEGFVLEHCLFKPEPGKRMGGFKDQVDAAGGAYNLLSGLKTGEGMRVFTIGESRHKGLRIVVCSRDNIAQTVTQHSALLISIQDPYVSEEVMQYEKSIPEIVGGTSTNNGTTGGNVNGSGKEVMSTPNPPAHGLSRCLGSLVLQFVDIAPKEHQDRWDELIQPWNKKPEDLQMSRDDGKKLWAFLLKKRDPNPDVIVLQDDDDRRALSIAYSICDVLHLSRTIIHVVANEEMSHKDKESPNEHVYNVSKLGRGMVVG